MAEPRRPLPAAHGSLAYGVPPSESGTLFVLAFSGGVRCEPGEGNQVTFGRNRPEVDVCVGEDDPRVSRTHGLFRHHTGAWWLHTSGRQPVRLPPARLHTSDEEPIALSQGYTPLFIRGSGKREHLLEVFVTGDDGRVPAPRHRDVTLPPTTWRLDDSERLALVVLAQRYLLHDPFPQPLTWRDTAAELDERQPDAGWTPRAVERLVERVRSRLSRVGGVAGLTRDEVGEPVGNTLNHNLIDELLRSTTLVPFDLNLLEEPGTGPGAAP
ncbi:MAG TPA: hypothetical protein VGL93_04190 [Streptosporangiaceae bacterium]|jgi:hypothetical protein